MRGGGHHPHQMSAGSSTDGRSPAAQFWLPPEGAKDRQTTQDLQRQATGTDGWLASTYQRLKSRWDSVWSESWTSRAEASAQPPGAEPEPWHGWVRRTAIEAREWIQSLDTTVMMGDSKHVWYSHGRPVVASLACSRGSWPVFAINCA